MGNKMLQDTKGNTSSKRVWGSIFLSCGGALLLAAGVCSFFIIIKDPDTTLTAGNWLAGIGAGLLGFGVIEHFGKKGGDE